MKALLVVALGSLLALNTIGCAAGVDGDEAQETRLASNWYCDDHALVYSSDLSLSRERRELGREEAVSVLRHQRVLSIQPRTGCRPRERVMVGGLDSYFGPNRMRIHKLLSTGSDNVESV